MWWSAAGDLATALFTGNPAEIVIGFVLVGPISLLISLLGLAWTSYRPTTPTSPTPPSRPAPSEPPRRGHLTISVDTFPLIGSDPQPART